MNPKGIPRTLSRQLSAISDFGFHQYSSMETYLFYLTDMKQTK